MKKSKKRIASLAIVAMMASSLLADASTVFALEKGDFSARDRLLKSVSSGSDSLKLKSKIGEVDSENSPSEKDPEELVRVIVELKEKPATLLVEDGVQPNEALVDKVIDAQEPIVDKVEEIAGEKVRHNYGNLINGFSIEVKRKDIDEIKNLERVQAVSETDVYYPDMATAKEYTEVLDVWEDYKYKGEGLVVSVIDTGIDYTHEDMKLTDSSTAKLKAEDVGHLGYGKYYSEKVPFGYNFADDDDAVIDESGSMHGMHVAGIVAANSSDSEGISGVAPEAQVLAMKVFTNNPEVSGAYTDDIIAAIEASVALGADVINMSLGSTAGFRDANEPDQTAIKNATDDGVLCVVSAGNATTSLDPYIIDGISDTSTVGSPGIATDSLQVASAENTNIKLAALTATIGGVEHLIGYTETDSGNPLDFFGLDEELEVVPAGVGSIDDFKAVDVKGKVALVQRGILNFVDKQLNAQNAGAIATIVYNNTADDSYINMATDSAVYIPSIFITTNNGNLLKDNAATTKIVFSGKAITTANGVAGEMSDFTSWGPTPDLQFAPQITGPGGNIYSTLNSNRYGSMSGTSMSAPHVAGATALIIQGLKEKGITLEGRELVEYVKKTVINTAEPLIEDTTELDETIPYSPRRQGPGMIQTKAAIDNTVLALGDDGLATVALKEIGDTTTFNLTLSNVSSEAKNFSIGSDYGVLTAFEPSMIGRDLLSGYEPFDVILDTASLSFSQTKVTVPANGEITVAITLKVKAGSVTNNFVEGFVNIKSTDGKNPDLVVPYMGYYGDWDAETIVDEMIWNYDDVLISPSFPATKVLGDYDYLGVEGTDSYGDPIINPNKIVISPNDDMLGDEIIPYLYLIRNAKEMKVDLLDKDGNLVKANVGSASNLRRNIFSNEGGDSPNPYLNLGWDGKLYDSKLGQYVVATEGNYILRYNAKVDGGDSYQTFEIPVEVDVTPVKTTLLSGTTSETTNYELNLGFNGELAEGNVKAALVYLNDGEKEVPVTLTGDNLTASLNLEYNKINQVTVLTMDSAYNIAVETYEIGVGKYKAEVSFLDLTEGSEFTTDVVEVRGTYVGDIASATVNGVPVDFVEDGVFMTTLNLNQGKNTLKFEFFDSHGDLVVTKLYRVYCFSEDPKVELQGIHLTENYEVHTVDGIVTLSGRFYDPDEIYTVKINGEVVPTTPVVVGNVEALVGTYGVNSDAVSTAGVVASTYREFTHTVTAVDGDIINVSVSDVYGNITPYDIKVVVDPDAPVIELDGLVDGKVYNTSVTPKLLNLDKYISFEATLNGTPYNFEEVSEDGNYELVVKVIGLNSLETTKTYKFTVDTVAPVVVVDGLVDNGVYNTVVTPVISYNEDVTTSLLLNGEAYNGEGISADGEYSLVAVAMDKAGNITTTVLSFIIDTVSPTGTTNLVDGMKYSSSVVPVVEVEEGSVYTMTLNDEVYEGGEIKAEGDYTLVIEITDVAKNVTKITKVFSVEYSKSPVIDNPTPTPTPTPKPKPNPEDGLPTEDDNGEVPSNDDDKNNNEEKPNTSLNNGSNNNSNTGKPGKGGLPTTGGTNTSLVFAVASLLSLIGFVFVLYKKKEEPNLEEPNLEESNK